MIALRRILGLFFVLAGTLHFVRPKPYRAIVPPWVPKPEEAVVVSGVAEVAGGLALLSDRTARAGGWWLILLLAAVFPANLHMAVNPDRIEGLDRLGLPTWSLWARLPLQPLLMALVWAATKPVPEDAPTG